jgi:hypothetical protein
MNTLMIVAREPLGGRSKRRKGDNPLFLFVQVLIHFGEMMRTPGCSHSIDLGEEVEEYGEKEKYG